MKVGQLLLEILLIVFVIAFPHVAHLPMYAYPVIVLGVLWIYLHFTGKKFEDIGFRFKDLSITALGIGGGIGIVFALFVFFILGPAILYVTGLPPADVHDFYFIRENFSSFIFLLLLACLWVIPYEEIVFRGFIMTTLWNRLGKRESAFWISGVLTSVLFAFYHLQEGYSAVISIFIGAILTTWLYKLFKGNLWYLISFHCTYDIVMLNFIRLGLM